MQPLGVVGNDGPLGNVPQGPNIGGQNPGVAPDPVQPDATAQPVGNLTPIAPAVAPKKNYTTYIIIGIAVLVVAYIAYRYYKK